MCVRRISRIRWINSISKNLENQTFTYVIPGSAQALTNAALPSYTFEMDYVENSVRKTGKFVKFFTNPDIVFTAINAPPTVTSTNTVGAVAINNNEIVECEAKKNIQIKDLTGAGDLFAGGFLHGLINNKSTKESLEIATEMSSKVIQIIGARLNS